MFKNYLAAFILVVLAASLGGCTAHVVGLSTVNNNPNIATATTLPTLEPTQVRTSETFTPTTAPTATPSPQPSATPTIAQASVALSEAPTLGAEGLRLAVPIRGSGKYLVAIEAGHGGIDEGTYPYNPSGELHYSEAQVNLAISLRLSEILVANGIRVFLVRDGDYEINPQWLDVNGDGEQDLADETQARLDLINASGADLLLSLHENARTYADGSVDPTWNGSTSYYCDARTFSELSYRFAQLVHTEALNALKAMGYVSFDQGIKDDLDIDDVGPQRHLVILGPHTDRIARPGEMPAALDEPLFATGYEESILLGRPDVLDALAQAYARAIIQYLAELD